jgi:hypothetical protein
MAVELVVLLRLVCVSFEVMTPLFIAFDVVKAKRSINEEEARYFYLHIILVDG